MDATHDDIMLAQNRHLPQALIGKPVEVVGSVLPAGPALGPAGLNKLICHKHREESQGGWRGGSGPRLEEEGLGAEIPGSSGGLVVLDGERGGPWAVVVGVTGGTEGDCMVAASPFIDL